MKILQNQVKCNKCGDTPYSAHAHDFKYCKCESIAVDGGTFYLKRLGDISDCEEMSISIPDKLYDDCIEAINWAKENKRNDFGLLCAFFRALRDNNYLK